MRPAIVRSTERSVLTVRANGPCDRATKQRNSARIATRARSRLQSTTPQNDAGCRIDPPVSEPKVATASPPPRRRRSADDPPGTRDLSADYGTRVK